LYSSQHAATTAVAAAAAASMELKHKTRDIVKPEVFDLNCFCKSCLQKTTATKLN